MCYGPILNESLSPHKGRGQITLSRFRCKIASLFLLGCSFTCIFIPLASAQAASPAAPVPPVPDLPDAPAPQNLAPQASPTPQPCSADQSAQSDQSTPAANHSQTSATSRINGVSTSPGTTATARPHPCKHYSPLINWYVQVVKGPPLKQNGAEIEPLTSGEKAWLAAHNLLDPFNFVTIGGEAAISVAANSHSGYGPGFPGWGRYMAVSFTQDTTGEFFDTFAIPALTHQDPRYFRMPDATIKRRIVHALAQSFWTRSDSGSGIPNYGVLGGFAIDDAIGNLYVPGQRTNVRSTVDRYLVGLATAPSGNFVVEFLPDVARRIHVQVVIIQRIINQVARNGGPEQP